MATKDEMQDRILGGFSKVTRNNPTENKVLSLAEQIAKAKIDEKLAKEKAIEDKLRKESDSNKPKMGNIWYPESVEARAYIKDQTRIAREK